MESMDLLSLPDIADVISKPLAVDNRAIELERVVPFLRYLCDIPHVQKIGVMVDVREKLIHLLVDPIHLDILKSVVGATCDWWDAHPGETYWEVLTVGADRFTNAADAYDLIVVPKGR
ncbi:MAG: hypothetical protein LBN04_03565 [Oscillospiraceae bacterium]|nr:hypothetical protein [Oscillospiraceae bacterium]